MKITHKKVVNSSLKIVAFMLSFYFSSTIANNISGLPFAPQITIKASPVNPRQIVAFTASNENIKQKPDSSILSKDYWIAKRALEKAVSKRNLATLRLGLKNEILTLRTKAVQSIKLFDDRSSVPDLIKTLEDNHFCMSGGTEGKLMQKRLNEEIISALKQFTGLDFLYLKKSSMVSCQSFTWELTDIEKVLIESRRWWKMYQRFQNRPFLRQIFYQF